MDFSLLFPWPGFCSDPFISLINPLRVLRALLLQPGIVYGPTCMSRGRSNSSHDEEDEVSQSIQFQGLNISVRGSASSSVDFVQRIAAASSPPASIISSAPPASSFSLPGTTASGRETRADILASFPACPPHLLRAASRLQASSSRYSGEQRVQRAWTAGNWALAVLRERVGSPNRSPTIELPNRHYVVLRGPGIDSPTFFETSRELFRAVGHLEGSDTICHGFPTKLEAEVYVAGSEAAADNEED